MQTVLRQPATDAHDAAVRWRQLVDLIARAGSAADPDLLAEALTVIRADSTRIEEPLRAAAARAIAALPLPLGLLECFVADRLSVSAPILAAATLDSAQWRVALAAADPETRRFIETLHPDLVPLAGDNAPAAPELSIGELVSRIERRRIERGAPAQRTQRIRSAPTPGDGPGLFLWESGANGEIDWVEGVPRGAMIGRSLARPSDGPGDRIGDEVVRAIGKRVPFRDSDLVVAGEGPASGRWLVSGAPAFDPLDGRFRGYRGSARRAAGHAVAEAAAPGDDARLMAAGDVMPLHPPLDDHSLRELVHELKTPLNAIIGFSEIIEGQFLGPAGRRYRERALDIAGEARLLLSAIDDLDLAAKVRSGDDRRSGSSQLDGVVTQAVNAHRHLAEERGVELAFAPPIQPVAAAVDAVLLSRLVGRLIRTMIELAVSGERLRLAVEQRGAGVRLTISRPVALTGSGREGGDYPFQLAQGLARIAGGEVRIDGGMVAADFPAA